MKKLLPVTIITVVLTTASALAQTSAKPAAAKTLTGVVSDSMCGAKHMAKDKSAAECTRECVKTGSDYALVVGAKVYPLKGDKAELDKYAGERATVKGTLDGNNINVQSITGAKKGTAPTAKMDHDSDRSGRNRHSLQNSAEGAKRYFSSDGRFLRNFSSLNLAMSSLTSVRTFSGSVSFWIRRATSRQSSFLGPSPSAIKGQNPFRQSQNALVYSPSNARL